jgi:TonB family protein
MLVVAEKIRSGLVELRTKNRLVYVKPSFSERLYLLWTFRNFHRLPVEVLNRHQRQLIERLGRTSGVPKQGPVPRSSLIGSVENVELALVSEARSPAGTGKVVRMSAPVTLIGKAAGSDVIATQTRRVNPTDQLIPFPGKSHSPEDISAPGRVAEAQAQPEKRSAKRLPQILMFQESGKWLGVGLLVACSLALLLFYSREERSVPSRQVPQAAIQARNPAPISSLSSDVAKPKKVQSSIAAQQVKAAQTIAPDSVSSQPTGEPQKPAELTKLVASEASPASAAQLDTVQRPHISEWPEGGFAYPIAPSRSLTGTVMLKAVIGIDGTVTSVDILDGNLSLAKAAAEAVGHWRYPPYKVNGVPTEAETNIVIDFRGDDAVSVSFPAK